MIELRVEPAAMADEVLSLVRSAVQSEMAKIQLGIEITRQRLAAFEQQCGVSSDEFLAQMAAEDLEGGDLEYVEWAGEYKMWQKLNSNLKRLEELQYAG